MYDEAAERAERHQLGDAAGRLHPHCRNAVCFRNLTGSLQRNIMHRTRDSLLICVSVICEESMVIITQHYDVMKQICLDACAAAPLPGDMLRPARLWGWQLSAASCMTEAACFVKHACRRHRRAVPAAAPHGLCCALQAGARGQLLSGCDPEHLQLLLRQSSKAISLQQKDVVDR